MCQILNEIPVPYKGNTVHIAWSIKLVIFLCLKIHYPSVLVIHWNLGSRTPLFTNNSVYEQIIRTKNVSDDERCLGLRTRKSATAVGDKLRLSARDCQLLVNFGSVHIPA